MSLTAISVAESSAARPLPALGLGLFTTRFLANHLATALPHTIPWTWLAVSTVLGVAMAASATYYPRRIAKRLTIVETLRLE